MTSTRQGHPLDGALRSRLHLPETSLFRLGLVRAALHTTDAVSQLFLGQTFFSLRAAEALLDEIGDKTGLALVEDLLSRRGGTKIIPHGLGYVPAQGAVIIASTHPTGLFEFLAHITALQRQRSDIKVVANLEAQDFLGKDNIVPVRISKKNQALSARSTHEAMQNHLKSGGALLIFGSGRVPYRTQDKLVEPAWRNGTSKISKRCDAPIVPAALDAKNSQYYYTLRKFSRYFSMRNDNIGAQIGSLRYAAELLEKLGGTYDVHYAPPKAPGTDSATLKSTAEGLVPGLYLSE
ncbi:hypothetical protein SAMN05444000_108113 [Shimia gijangensis]|uniref:Phospholipid/glycerol acyltransferase domain-containing protein n=1 Tax=Shimia gijangensis TaxID=1470563 RepID=A0A1M6J5N9_9RHOB|nr:hypothetical protein [Shimia gijangensis]SHJ41941.1 hypothetical protein SAMN05444000_108113 [Shimia gijangensis]